MSENKEDSNSTPSDVKEEEKSVKDEEAKNVDESSKDSEKDSAKEDSVKDGSAKEDSVKDESGKEESDESEDEEGMGLLDRPVEVTGCRARKKVERLEVSFATPTNKSLEIPEGKGDKLGDCPMIEFQIQKNMVNDLKTMHRILFNRVGSVYEIKKNIRKFSGFPFAKGSPEYDRKKASVEKLTSTILKHVCEILDLERGGVKEDIVTRVMEFLIKPKNSGKVPGKAQKKKTSSKDKKKTSEKKTNSKKAGAKKEVSSSDGGDSANESASEPSSVEDDKDKSGSDVETKKKAKTTKAKKTPKPAAKKSEKKNKKEEKKTAAKGIKRKRDDDDDDSSISSEDKPVTKKSKIPTDDDIKKLVKRILDSADLQEITMKKVIKQVADAYPECDLSHKKGFIKSTIKSVIS